MNNERSPALPNLPTAPEQGATDLVAYTWNAVFLPKGTPEAIVKKLNAAIVAAKNTPAVRDRLQSLGAQIVTDQRATPRISRQVPARRNRQMGGADQGERRDGGLTRARSASLKLQTSI